MNYFRVTFHQLLQPCRAFFQSVTVFAGKNYSFPALTLLLITAMCAGMLGLLIPATQAAGTITGRVFQDYNGNGNYDTAGDVTNPAVDAGVQNVTVTAYDSSGTAQGSATTAANGTYSLTATGTGPYRLEFTTLPIGLQPSARSTNSVNGGTATNAGSAVQFVADGNTANVNLAINKPQDYCQNNPLVCIPQYQLGNTNAGSLKTFPYNYSSELDGNLGGTWTTAPSRGASLAPTAIETNDHIGSVYGLAWNRATKNLYASAFIKRGAKLGALSGESTGAIYAKNNPASALPAATVYVDLNTVFGAGTTGANPHPAATTTWTDPADTGTISLVGKRGLGDLEISQDGSSLYVVNLTDRQLYVIPTSGTLNSTTITRFAIPTSGLAATGGNCATADVRPFSLGRDGNGNIYVGGVCSAESEAADTKVHAYVWRFDNPGFTLVANRALSNFTRYLDSTDSTVAWQQWSNTVNQLNIPAPMVGDIEFDGTAMIIGIRDRYGDQVVFPNYYRGYGDLMRACPSGATWTFENNATCGAITTAGDNSNSGPGGGEYYIDLNGDNRDEGLAGSLLQVPGFNHTLTTAYDAVTYNSSGTRSGNFYTAGVQRYNNTTGVMSGAYDVYLQADTNTFGKANGIGDIEALCDSAPLEIGNRVWRDTDGDGVQDAGEAVLSSVTVGLYNSGGTLIATSVTDANGEYYFIGGTAADPDTADNQGIVNGVITPNTDYQIRILNAEGGSQQTALAGLQLTDTNADATTNGDARDNDASMTGNNAIIALTTGAAGANNHNSDFGFAPQLYSLGNRIWNDVNNNGLRDTGEIGISGVTVNLLDSAGNPADGDPNTAGVQAVTTTTDSNGYYRFDNLAAGNYIVEVVPPVGFASSTVNGGDPDTNPADNDDNGVVISGGNIRSLAVTLGAQAEPTGETDLGPGAQGNRFDNQANMTVDFGFFQSVSIGNRVWNDANNNGIQDGGEAGIVGATVNLYFDADDNGVITGTEATTIVATTTTVANGLYLFSGLESGNYQVGIVTPSGFASSLLNGGDPDTNAADNDDNGVLTVGTETRSNVVTLSVGGEPTGENPDNDPTTPDNSENLTVDFGFYPAYSIGNRVWSDNNDNGLRDTGELGLANITVNLLDSAGNPVDGDPNTAGVQAITTTTDSNGYYRFDNLAAGNYIVEVVTPNGYVSSSVNGGDPDTNPADNDDNGVVVSGGNIRSNPVTLGAQAEPTGETDLGPGGQGAVDNQANMTVDFGFVPNYSLGNRVWVDTNNDGLLNNGESGINGVSVSIFTDTNSDGTIDTPNTPLATQNTAGGGYYRFDTLTAGNYIVRVNPVNFQTGGVLLGRSSSTTTVINPNNDTDSDDNGYLIGQSTVTGVQSGSVTLGTGASEPIGETDLSSTDAAHTDNLTNLTADFGFYTPSGPTLAKLTELTAFNTAQGVRLEWQSGYEMDNLGYRVWREQDGARSSVNKELIAGSALQVGTGVALPAGAHYRLTDRKAKDANTSSVYWLEDVDVKGNSTWHGPIGAINNQSAAAEITEDSVTLDKLTDGAPAARQTESVAGKSTVANKSAASRNSATQQALLRGKVVKNNLAQDENAVQIEVAQDGWVRVSRSDLASAGFNVNSNPATWQLFVGGTEIPLQLTAEGVAFEGRASLNHETDGSIYWLTVGAAGGKRIGEAKIPFDDAATAGWFNQQVERRDRRLRASAILNGAEENFYADIIGNTAVETALDLPQIAVESGAAARVQVNLQGFTQSVGNHEVEVMLNETSLGVVSFSGRNRSSFEREVALNTLREGNNIVSLRDLTANSYTLLEAVSITFPRRTMANGNRLTLQQAAGGGSLRVGGFTSQAVRIVDITDETNPQLLYTKPAVQTDNTFALTLPATATARIIRCEPAADVVTARNIVRNQASNWHNRLNGADFVIIAPAEYAAAAEPLRQRRNAEGLRSVFVATQDIYDEFSDGERSPEAVKAFLQFAATNWAVKPKYVLLLGHATVDPRNYTGLAGTNFDQVPSMLIDSDYMETVSDDALGDFDGDGISELSIGRMPVTSASEAATVITRSLRAEDEAGSETWANRGALLVNDAAIGYNFADGISRLRTQLPATLAVETVSRTDGETENVRERIVGGFNRGVLLVHYFGHGSNNIWSNAGILRNEDTLQMTNGDRLPLVIAMTCLNGAHGEAGLPSLAEMLVKSPAGGARGVWAASTLVDAEAQEQLTAALYANLFTPQAVRFVRLGDAMREAKSHTPNMDVRRTFTYFGDPTSPFVRAAQ